MKVYKCDGCDRHAEAPTGRKPEAWFERTWDEKKLELHACSRECIVLIASRTGSHSCVLPI